MTQLWYNDINMLFKNPHSAGLNEGPGPKALFSEEELKKISKKTVRDLQRHSEVSKRVVANPPLTNAHKFSVAKEAREQFRDTAKTFLKASEWHRIPRGPTFPLSRRGGTEKAGRN